MAELVEVAKEGKLEEEMNALYESSMKNQKEGRLLKGKIIGVSEEGVIVDVGMKSEGRVPIKEFLGRDGKLRVQVGDEVEVMLLGKEEEGLLILSKQRADMVRVWEKIRRSNEHGEPIEGEIVSEVKGGFMVDVGIKAYLPLSQVDRRPVKNPSSFVGRRFKFRVIKIDSKKGNVILSRKAYLIEEAARRKAEFWRSVRVGDSRFGIVKRITDEGAIVDLNGVTGFLPKEELSWGKVSNPRDLLRVGDELRFKVIELDKEKEDVKLSLRQLKPDPWSRIEEKYPVGSKVTGKVTGITKYGAFVELEKGVEGLLHITEMSWDKDLKNPKKVVSKGKSLELMVIDVDKEKRRLSLSLKRLLPDPWDVLMTKYPPGSLVTGKIKNITDFGIFVGVEGGIDGLVHVSEASWSRRKVPLNELFKPGQVVNAVVLNVDKDQKKFSLSLKRAKKEDPWNGVEKRYQPGDVLEGYITSIVDFGVFVELEEGVEGLVHVSQMDGVKGKKPYDVFKLDEKVRVKVLSVDEKAKKLALSMRLED